MSTRTIYTHGFWGVPCYRKHPFFWVTKMAGDEIKVIAAHNVYLKKENEHLKDVLYEIDMQNRMAKDLIRKLLKNPLKFEIRTVAENFLRGEK